MCPPPYLLSHLIVLNSTNIRLFCQLQLRVCHHLNFETLMPLYLQLLDQAVGRLNNHVLEGEPRIVDQAFFLNVYFPADGGFLEVLEPFAGEDFLAPISPPPLTLLLTTALILLQLIINYPQSIYLLLPLPIQPHPLHNTQRLLLHLRPLPPNPIFLLILLHPLQPQRRHQPFQLLY